MNSKNENTSELYYFPERLSARLAKIPDYPVTFVEAPSGFGKTTAVREYLKKRRQEGARESWHTCLGEPPWRTWEGICGLFGGVDPDTAARLKELGPPMMETIADVAALVRGCRVQAETFLVVDNYQLFENGILREIMNAFCVHGNEGLHIVFITQPLPVSRQSVYDANTHKLGSIDFLFDLDSTSRLCRLFGVNLRKKELDYVQKISEGWVAVIRLQAENYRETGSFTSMSGMDSLIETAIWNRISTQNREFLMSVSLLDAFTPRQAAIMLDTSSLSQRSEDLLRRNAFIPYSEERGVYYMHTILRDFLRQRFESASADFRFETLRRAGRACEAVHEYFEAARFFNEVRDYDAILSMPLTNQYFYNMERKIIEFFGELLDECDEEILLKYPITLLTVGNQFFKNGMHDRFSRVAGLLQKLIDKPSGLSERELTRVKGEFELMMFFTQFNDIAKMSECHRRAYTHLKQLSDSPRSIIFSGAVPSWTLGITSVLCLYWRKPGELEKTLSIMDECLPIYTGLAGGHGAGGEYIIRAEASLNRGSDAEAEAMCYKALYEARSARQFGNCLCAELVLARIALLRGDGKAYDAARQSVTRDAKEACQTATLRMGELCLALLDMSLGRTTDIPDWLRDIEGIRNVLYILGQPYALMFYGKFLLLEQRYTKLYGITELVMDITRRMNYLLPQVYQLIYLAAAKHLDSSEKEAEGYLREALDMALPDKVYLPFAEHGSFILPMIENMKKGFEPGAMGALIALCRRQVSGTNAVKKALSPERLALTPRQREIALLTKGGLSAKEIASELFITENTVKSAIKIIYDKLDIHSKTDLRKIEL